jgi:predicted neuraminidase
VTRHLAACSALLLLAFAGAARAEEPHFAVEAVFPAEKKHNHASCVAELPDGTLFLTWYRGTGERTADDVEIFAARKAKGEATWGERFLLADAPGYPDCNPALFVAPDDTLWMWRPVILDHRWEGALLMFSVAKGPDYPAPGKPVAWSREGVHHVTPVGFDTAMADALKTLNGATLKLAESYFDKIEERSKDLLYQRLGWMPRVRAIALPSGRWLLPLYCDTFSTSIVSYSDDRGATWKTSAPIIGFGAIQPSLVRKSDGTIVAYMRDNGPFRKIRTCTSADEGATWSKVTSTELPNPGAGIEAIALSSGKWAMIYNDTVAGRHSLALSLSDDEGETWKWTRHVALDPSKKESFHYPSLMQAKDGTIHVTYTHGNLPEGSRMDHAAFNEAWVMAGDDAPPSR